MPGLQDIVRRAEELNGEIKSADAIVTEDRVHRDRAKRTYDQAEAKLTKSIATAVDKRSERDALATRAAAEITKAGEPLDPSEHTPIYIEDEDERTNQSA